MCSVFGHDTLRKENLQINVESDPILHVGYSYEHPHHTNDGTRDNRLTVHNAALAREIFPDVGEKTQK